MQTSIFAAAQDEGFWLRISTEGKALRTVARTCGVLLGVCLAFSFISPAQARKPLSYANHLSANHPVNLALKTYFDGLTEATNGDLKFQMFPGGAMGGGKALLGLARDGVVDSSFINALYEPSSLPVEAMIAQLLYPNSLVVAGAQNEMFLLHCPQCNAELAKNNVVPLMYYATPTYYLLCTKPIANLREAQGVKVRSVGSFGRLSAALGMTPVNLTSDETYQSLQRGQLSCALGSLDWLTSYSLQDVIKDITDLPMGAIGGLMHLGFNQTSWKSLTDAERTAIRKGLAATVADLEFQYEKGSEQARQGAKTKNIAFVSASAEMKARVAQYHKDELKQIIAKAESGGIDNAAALMDEYLKLIAKWEKIVAKAGKSQKEYEQALNDEIFSKLK
jgi:TRAP-type C4-dicarboxylate transport system substrate-binding protein